MGLAAIILMILLVPPAVGAAMYFGFLVWRIVTTSRMLPTVRAGLGLPEPEGGWPRVCVIVPAHNEEEVIEEHVRSVLGQDYPKLRMVMSLDRCTDRTEEIVRRAAMRADGTMDPRLEIVTIRECAEGWVGKSHAVWRGVQESEGAKDAELYLFADADTRFEPGLVRAAAALLIQRKLDLLSLLSELTKDLWFEKLVQPAAGFELVRQFPLDVVNREVRPRAFANGQFMMFRRELYDRVGGHELVKSELLEDIMFVRKLNRMKTVTPSRWGVLMPGRPGLLRCRMYRSWETFRRGWKRIYMESSSRRPEQLRKYAWRGRVMGSVLPAGAVACMAAGLVMLLLGENRYGFVMLVAGGVGSAAFVTAVGMIYRDQGVPLRWIVMYPVGAWMVSGILLEASRDLVRGVKTVWAGREYSREIKG